MKEDFLLLEIRKIGLMLQQALERLLQQPSSTDTAEDENKRIEETKQTLCKELHIDLGNPSSARDDVLNLLLANKAMNMENMELLANIFFQLGEKTTDRKEQKSLFDKALCIYEYLENFTQTFSIGRQRKMQLIEEINSADDTN